MDISEESCEEILVKILLPSLLVATPVQQKKKRLAKITICFHPVDFPFRDVSQRQELHVKHHETGNLLGENKS